MSWRTVERVGKAAIDLGFIAAGAYCVGSGIESFDMTNLYANTLPIVRTGYGALLMTVGVHGRLHRQQGKSERVVAGLGNMSSILSTKNYQAPDIDRANDDA